jgi:CheY-like chemotaxis protein
MKQKKILFVDDDAGFLAAIRDLFKAMSGGSWAIFIAENHSQALDLLHKEHVDLVVLDIGMPCVDGFQFLRLLNSTHPGQPVVMLTGEATEEQQKLCLQNGAKLSLAKPVTPEGFSTIFSALDRVAEGSKAGFRANIRPVALADVLQMECLNGKSSVIEIFSAKVRGKIFICEGSIVHAEADRLIGETALYGLIALRNTEFNLKPYSEPPHRTIEGHWEFLLIEAIRLRDEGTQFFEWEKSMAVPVAARSGIPAPASAPFTFDKVSIQETLLCSGAGEVLYQSGCSNVDHRARLLEGIEQQAAELSAIARVGRFDRLEILTADGRIVCQVQPDRRVFVRSATPHPVPL